MKSSRKRRCRPNPRDCVRVEVLRTAGAQTGLKEWFPAIPGHASRRPSLTESLSGNTPEAQLPPWTRHSLPQARPLSAKAK